MFTISDEAIGVMLKSCETNSYTLLVTADHGNAERMIDEHGNPVTKHTTYRGGREFIVMLITVISSISTKLHVYGFIISW